MVWQKAARSACGCAWSATLNADCGSSRQLREGDVNKFRLPTWAICVQKRQGMCLLPTWRQPFSSFHRHQEQGRTGLQEGYCHWRKKSKV